MRTLTVWLLCLSLLGCTKPDEVTPAASAEAVVGDWVLVDPASAYTVTLTVNELSPAPMAGFYSIRFSGRSSVNTYFMSGLFSKGPSIESGEAGTGSVSGLGATKMAGPPEAMRFETDYFQRLGSVNRIERTGAGRLRLSHTQPSPGVLIYQRQ